MLYRLTLCYLFISWTDPQLYYCSKVLYKRTSHPFQLNPKHFTIQSSTLSASSTQCLHVSTLMETSTISSQPWVEINCFQPTHSESSSACGVLQLHNKCARVQDAVYSATDAVSTRALCNACNVYHQGCITTSLKCSDLREHNRATHFSICYGEVVVLL